ncbi:hypothetical protein CMI37_10725 [Candidatus Pacearchaeota archaeon]|nr:hypothetical protein [Candidatus Pacearchaeota archaeon]|tara:strand:- start:1555 stop:2064 length:510 start_codon:yes stop_codon:yes gene_type:complete
MLEMVGDRVFPERLDIHRLHDLPPLPTPELYEPLGLVLSQDVGRAWFDPGGFHDQVVGLLEGLYVDLDAGDLKVFFVAGTVQAGADRDTGPLLEGELTGDAHQFKVGVEVPAVVFVGGIAYIGDALGLPAIEGDSNRRAGHLAPWWHKGWPGPSAGFQIGATRRIQGNP